MPRAVTPRISADQWIIARSDWESGRLRTKAQVARKWKVTAAAVRQQAMVTGWKRIKKQVEDLGPEKLGANPIPDSALPPLTGGNGGKAPPEMRSAIVSALFAKHLREWNTPRGMLRSAITLGPDGGIIDINTGRAHAAAAAASALAKVQSGERLALGIKEGENEHDAGVASTNVTVILQNTLTQEQRQIMGKITEVVSKPEDQRKRPGQHSDILTPRGEVTPPAPQEGVMIFTGGASPRDEQAH